MAELIEYPPYEKLKKLGKDVKEGTIELDNAITQTFTQMKAMPEDIQELVGTGGKTIREMIDYIEKAVEEQKLLDNEKLNKTELEVFKFLGEIAKTQMAKEIFDGAIENIYREIIEKSSDTIGTDAWGTFIEREWFSVMGGEHSKSSADLEKDINNHITAEIKLTGGAKQLLAGQISFWGFEVDTFLKKGEGGKLVEKVAVIPEQLNNPYFRMTATLYKMIYKMYNMLYLYVTELEPTAEGTFRISIDTMILFTTLWIEKLFMYVLNSINVTIATQAGGLKQDGDMQWKHTFEVKITQKEGDVISSIERLAELYRRALALIVNSRVVGAFAKVKAAFKYLREPIEAFSINEAEIEG